MLKGLLIWGSQAAVAVVTLVPAISMLLWATRRVELFSRAMAMHCCRVKGSAPPAPTKALPRPSRMRRISEVNLFMKGTPVGSDWLGSLREEAAHGRGSQIPKDQQSDH